ncbi:hypothetical protein GBA52_028702 [Prunus armeniaca]|nr:hypothetical protein GBA52_028702 [Prunus armeniaca]
MVTPGAEAKDRATPEQVADYTLRLLRKNESPCRPRESWQAPHNSFLSGGQSEVEATLNLNAMNQAPNPWHVSFSYARALQNTCLKKWGGRPENVKEAQEALLVRAKANSLAQLGKYTGEGESEESKQGMFVKGYPQRCTHNSIHSLLSLRLLCSLHDAGPFHGGPAHPRQLHSYIYSSLSYLFTPLLPPHSHYLRALRHDTQPSL